LLWATNKEASPPFRRLNELCDERLGATKEAAARSGDGLFF
jgi:hypothetical protein